MLYNSRLISITISKPTSLNSTTQTSDRSKTSYSKLRSMASSTWLSKLQKFLDLVSNQRPSRYNIDNVGTEGGLPGIHPAFGSGQDSFLASLATKGTTSLVPYVPTSRTPSLTNKTRHHGQHIPHRPLLLPKIHPRKRHRLRPLPQHHRPPRPTRRRSNVPNRGPGRLSDDHHPRLHQQ